MIELVRPLGEHREKALNFKKAFFENGEMIIDGSEMLDIKSDYDEWLAYVSDNACLATLRKDCVLTDTFFAMVDGEIVGIIDFRHELSHVFRDIGHVGYSVVPWMRRRGVASEMLARVVAMARECGLMELQLAAYRSNVASIRTIVKNGGHLVRSFDYKNQVADVYIINL